MARRGRPKPRPGRGLRAGSLAAEGPGMRRHGPPRAGRSGRRPAPRPSCPHPRGCGWTPSR
eukprot:4109994-Lingulodinium_polyedra.AAC.1